MNELQGTLRPVKLRPNATRHTDIDPLGEITTSVRYRYEQDMGVIEVLDEAVLPYTDGADGTGLFSQDGELLTWFQFFSATPGADVQITPGWGFRAQEWIDVAAAERLQLAKTASG